MSDLARLSLSPKFLAYLNPPPSQVMFGLSRLNFSPNARWAEAATMRVQRLAPELKQGDRDLLRKAFGSVITYFGCDCMQLQSVCLGRFSRSFISV